MQIRHPCVCVCVCVYVYTHLYTHLYTHIYALHIYYYQARTRLPNNNGSVPTPTHLLLLTPKIGTTHGRARRPETPQEVLQESNIVQIESSIVIIGDRAQVMEAMLMRRRMLGGSRGSRVIIHKVWFVHVYVCIDGYTLANDYAWLWEERKTRTCT